MKTRWRLPLSPLLPGLAFGLALFLLLAGCHATQDSTANFFAVVTDQAGREVTLADSPQRMISLSPSNTEIAFALGLAGRIVAVTDYCNYPPEAAEKEKIGGFSTPSLEKMLELEPDLVLAGNMHEALLPQLEELGINTLVLVPGTLEEIATAIILLAETAGINEQGEALVASMRERIDQIRVPLAGLAETEKVRVYYEVYSDPLMTAGAGTIIDEIIALAGGVNIFGDVAQDYPKVSAELVVERQPEVILFPNFHGTAGLMQQTMAERTGWRSIPAVQEDRAYAVDDDCFARPGPRIVEAVEEAARLFYPDRF